MVDRNTAVPVCGVCAEVGYCRNLRIADDGGGRAVCRDMGHVPEAEMDGQSGGVGLGVD